MSQASYTGFNVKGIDLLNYYQYWTGGATGSTGTGFYMKGASGYVDIGTIFSPYVSGATGTAVGYYKKKGGTDINTLFSPILTPTNISTLYLYNGVNNTYIVDTGNNRIQFIPLTSGTYFGQVMTANYVYTIGGLAAGTLGLGTNGQITTSSALGLPNGIYIDSPGNIYIADTNNNRIQFVPITLGTYFGQVMTANYVYTIAGLATGLAGLGTNGQLATNSALSSPNGVYVDSMGNIYISDSGNNRIQFVPVTGGTNFGQAMTANWVYTIAGLAGGNTITVGTFNGNPTGSPSSSSYSSVAVSSKGQYQIACINGGSTYLSTNYGTSFTGNPSGLATAGYNSVSISSTGQYMLICSNNSTKSYTSLSTTSGTPPTSSIYGAYTVLTFKTSGTTTISFSSNTKIGYLVVGGGSATQSQSYYYGGGGGGVSWGTIANGVTVASGTTLSVLVAGSTTATTGNNSSITGTGINIVAYGGSPTGNGGSSSGGANNGSGGNGGVNTGSTVGNGGDGPLVSFPDIAPLISNNYGGGGGSGTVGNYLAGGAGGLGGGGAGGGPSAGSPNYPGTPNTGGGGGGQTGYGGGTTATGGSGIIIIYYLTSITSLGSVYLSSNFGSSFSSNPSGFPTNADYCSTAISPTGQYMLTSSFGSTIQPSIISGNLPTSSIYGAYTVLTFKTAGTTTIAFSSTTKLGYLVVGGGSATQSQSYYYGGGGGGVSWGSISSGVTVASGTTLSVMVAGSSTTPTGNNSSVAGIGINIVAFGGTPTGTGGSSSGGANNGSGGNGGVNTGTTVGNGGDGPLVSIPDIAPLISNNYGGGGGSGTIGNYVAGGAGGLGGGGAGGGPSAGSPNYPGTANTGGGGGGRTGYGGGTLAEGGSGIIIIYYLTPTTSVGTVYLSSNFGSSFSSNPSGFPTNAEYHSAAISSNGQYMLISSFGSTTLPPTISGAPTTSSIYGAYTVLTFKTAGTTTIAFSSNTKIGYLVVGGGSATQSQSYYYGGGGGGVSWGTIANGVTVVSGTTLSILVAGSSATPTGNNSSIAGTGINIVAFGGTITGTGGSSSGGANNGSGGNGGQNGAYTVGNGGDGPSVSIPDIAPLISNNYGGGGGSGTVSIYVGGGAGGLGGGGAGGGNGAGSPNYPGTANTGGGGGGRTGYGGGTLAEGGSGIVIIYYLTSSTTLLGSTYTPTPTPGSAYISNNYGSSFALALQASSSTNFTSVSLSSSGQYQMACTNPGGIYISTNFGSTFTLNNSGAPTSTSYSSVSVSSTGQYMLAAVNGGSVYLSMNYGTSFTANPGSLSTGNYSSIAISSTGQYMLTCINGGSTYLSKSNGNTGTNGQLTTNSALNVPSGIFTDSNKNIYIADTYNNRIQFVPQTAGSYFGSTMTANYVYTISGLSTGTGGIGANGQIATSSALSLPNGVYVDSTQNIYIADTGNNRIQFIPKTTGTYFASTMTTNWVYTIAGLSTGVSGLGATGQTATTSALNAPTTLYIDSANNIYISDTGNNRTQFLPTTTGTYFGQSMTANYIYTIAGLAAGTAGIGTNNQLATNSALNGETSLFVTNYSLLKSSLIQLSFTLSVPTTTSSTYTFKYYINQRVTGYIISTITFIGSTIIVNIPSTYITLGSMNTIYISVTNTFGESLLVGAPSISLYFDSNGTYVPPPGQPVLSGSITQAANTTNYSANFTVTGNFTSISWSLTNASLSSTFTGSTASTVSPVSVAFNLSSGSVYYNISYMLTIYSTGPGGTSTTNGSYTITTPPASPTLSTITAGTTSISIPFTLSIGATSYSCYYGTTSSFSSATLFSTTITSSPVSITGLTSNTTYYVFLVAVSSYGSSPVASSGQILTAPVAPTNVTTTGSGNYSIDFSFTTSTGATSYSAYYNTSNTFATATKYTPSSAITSSPASIAGLNSSTTYYIFLVANSANGSSTYASGGSRTTTTPYVPPPVPPAPGVGASVNGNSVTVYITSSNGATSFLFFGGNGNSGWTTSTSATFNNIPSGYWATGACGSYDNGSTGSATGYGPNFSVP